MTDATSFEVAEPILSSPFEEPPEHWWIEEGKLPRATAWATAGRLLLPRPVNSPSTATTDIAEASGCDLDLVNLVRAGLAGWRAKATPEPRRTTRELMEYWRRDGRQWPLFFAQLEAVETVLFLREAVGSPQGVVVPREDGGDFLRCACKMATGSGKTIVMGMLAAWSILNKVASKG